MTELREIFAELGISHYLNDFIEQGFDSWDTILDITESDFDALGVKLGHRRKLQRKIANSRGLSSDRALGSPTRNTPSDDRQAEEHKGNSARDGKEAGTGTGSGPHGAKRKYRRHPKSDENAPERPPSAYVIFSNKMREELKEKNLSFTEIAKLVGENWQSLSPGEKEPYEQQAFTAKEKYNAELAEYKKTSQFREYSQYLVEFKARQSNQQQVNDLEVTKRPKLENQMRTVSSGTTSSSTSQQGRDTPTGRARVEPPAATSTGQWPAHDDRLSPAMALPVGQTGKSLSPASSSGTLPGYREAIFGGSSQSLPWREGNRDENSMSLQQHRRVTGIGDRQSYPGPPMADSLNPTGGLQHAHRMVQGRPPPPPPSLISESTKSSGSSASTNSPAFLTPRTPLEPHLERSLPIPSLFPQKSTGTYENQLPPLRVPSLSPQSAMLGSQNSPNNIPGMQDFPTSMPPMRGYPNMNLQESGPADNNDPRIREFGSPEDNNLDPVSALLRAGEIVNQKSRGPPRN
ncbi:hypothetical protein M430DRAFT_131761 [Amorphotheca resinae ATCC 22711]|uniref:HMG box domain-containing protein n=1 Tax=Amorphotheca resinae ATCC 22711 TaxID=857342 RepID=A0A2T3BEK2_AMORE|nr:hypothetical protein M430DRAFT_131761 [Amorphotheca resinae ATCC 22711]PSS27836.1 hypothetical protein M430DRAFT_131761 [Amorphotheca resinae ATCC 22711]